VGTRDLDPMQTKEERWLACARKSCCRDTIVYPSGTDIYRISTTLLVPPWDFTVALPAPDTAEDGFALDRTNARYRAALAKSESTQACTFLIFALDDAARCGLGALRPGPCHSFPSYLDGGEVKLMQGVCSCRTWTVDDVDVDLERDLLLAQARERETYKGVIGSWNAFVARAGDEGPYEYSDYCRYLLDAYAQMANATV